MLIKLITCLLFIVVFYGQQIDADSKCERYDTRSYKYKCKHIRECSSGSRGLVGCGKGKICCPTYRRPKRQATEINPYEVAKNKCRQYAELRYVINNKENVSSKEIDCPSIRGNIAGGINAVLKEFPHTAVLGYHPVESSGQDEDWSCGGTLISEKYVLTAAHCIAPSYKPRVVRLGDLILNTIHDKAPHRDYKIAKIISHPEYNSSSKYNDIALLELNKDVQLSPSIRPACLYTSPNVPQSENKITITGFGITGETRGDRLLKATIKMLPGKRCKTHYKQSSEIVNSYDSKMMMCAGDKDEKSDTCQGDSGGPIQVQIGPCVWAQLGIASFGKICGVGQPAVYTKVFPYIPWIQSIVWPRGV